MLITIEILPKTLADARPAGKGRSEPNTNPFLPPPTGRMKLVRRAACTGTSTRALPPTPTAHTFPP